MKPIMKLLFTAALLGSSAAPSTAAPRNTGSCHRTENVITVIVDGLRWEEVFRGVDPRFLEPEAKDYFKNDFFPFEDFKRAYWRDKIEERRNVLMPFFWSTIANQGQLIGNRDLNSTVALTNHFHISYPGHNEFLSGFADDARITSNAFKYNPNVTFLEYMNGKGETKGRVADFSTWDAYPYILNAPRSRIAVQTPKNPLNFAPGNQRVEVLHELLQDMGPSLHSDAITFHLAMEYLKLKRPKLLHITFSNTDRTAHAGSYGDYANAAHSSDSFLRRLWAWVQNDPGYRDKTTLIVAADHGRGAGSLERWRHHGAPGYRKIEDGEINPTEGDQYSWIAAIGPDTPAAGFRGDITVSLSQVANTAVGLLGDKLPSDADGQHPAPPIEQLIRPCS